MNLLQVLKLKNVILSLAVSAFAGLLVCCVKPPEEEPRFKLLEAMHQTDQFDDDGVLSDVRALVFEDEKLFVSDFDNGRVLVLDSAFQPQYQIGTPGPGPGEFNHTGWIHIKDGLVFAENEGTQAIYLFDQSGNLEGQIEIPSITLFGRFFFKDGELFLPTPGKTQPISVYDLEGKHLRSIGEAFPSENWRERRARGLSHLQLVKLDGHEYFLAVDQTEAVIRLYDLDGTMLHETSLRNHPTMRDRLDFAQSEYTRDRKNRERSYIAITDVAVQDDVCYLLTAGNHPSRIPKFKITLEGVTELTEYRLPIQAEFITIGNDTLFAYVRPDGTLYAFSMK